MGLTNQPLTDIIILSKEQKQKKGNKKVRTVRYITSCGNVTENFAVAKAEGIKETFLLEIDEISEGNRQKMFARARRAEQKRRERKG